MTTLEETTIDKSTWGDGPWQDEPDKKRWRDESTGYPCEIFRNYEVGNLCGYVGVPHNHPAFKQDYETVDVHCHGGLTYSGFDKEVVPGEEERVWWLGFDCGHFGDTMPGIAAHISLEKLRDTQSRYKDFSYVEIECRELAKQLKELEV